MTFHVGQKVVCVNGEFSDKWRVPSIKNFPVARRVYTVRKVGMFKFLDDAKPAIWLEEIVNPIVRWADGEITEIAFAARRFRPVVERKTDISIFTAMLKPNRVDA